MLIFLVFMIFLILAGAVAVDVITTLAGGAVFIVILLAVLTVRYVRRGGQDQRELPAEYRIEREGGVLYCDDCKYCAGNACLLGHRNPETGAFSPICEEDFLPRDAELPRLKKVR